MLRLATDVPLANDTKLRITHRVDIPRHYCICGRCAVRATVGALSLANGRRPNMVFTHLKFDDGKVLQKYYEVSTHVGDAIVPSETTTVSGRQEGIKTVSSSARGQILGIGIWERPKTAVDSIFTINSLLDPDDHKNSMRFTVEFWTALLTVFGMVLFFVVLATFACFSEWREEGDVIDELRLLHRIALSMHLLAYVSQITDIAIILGVYMYTKSILSKESQEIVCSLLHLLRTFMIRDERTQRTDEAHV